ncbi:hypothetical protein FKW77_008487 [Venturia effusa]|uniref:Uncharacterized protein n=1 Tax=Venturia effusa TaxID=50376 RepID=A0A517LEB7_9PEZI|nr:hypothetical protein FKW77_008487 [Venturia effusa]
MKAAILLFGSLAAFAQAISINFCTDANFGGTCGTYNVPNNACWNVPAARNDKISSLDTFGATCTFWRDGKCGGTSFKATGRNPLIPANMNDKISSLKCT